MTVRQRLMIMMFLQYAVWGSWAVSMGGYLDQSLGYTGTQIGGIYSTTAVAAMLSPLLIGLLADKFFATQHVLAGLHLIGGVLLGLAAITTQFNSLYSLMLAYALCYMPTLALTNSISFSNIADPEQEFPGIRVLGTWGWIIAGWIVALLLWEKLALPPNAPIFLAAGLSIALGIFCFALPHTPPKREATPEAEENRSSVLGLLLDRSFLVFVICSFLICIPLSFYYSFANVFLNQIDAPAPTALQTIGQLSEVGFMTGMPLFISILGVKRMLAVGMLAWVVRYVCFASLSFPLVLFGLFLHGICYDFFFVASQIYVDGRCSTSQRSSAQSFLAFVTLGLGMFIGSYAGGYTVDHYSLTISAEVQTGSEPSQRKPVPLPKLLANDTGALAITADHPLRIDSLPERVLLVDKGVTTTLRRDALASALKAADANVNGEVTRAEYDAYLQSAWTKIWLAPAVLAGVTLVVFWIGFSNRRDPSVESAMAKEAPLGAGEGFEPQVG